MAVIHGTFSMPITTIIRGENKHLVRALMQTNGAPLLLALLDVVSVELKRGPKVLATYVLGVDDELIANPGDTVGNQVQLEITTAMSSNTAGPLTEVWKIELSDLGYVGGISISKVSNNEIVLV